MFSETLNLCVDRQLQAALTDFADQGGEAAGRAVREQGERAISGLRRKLTVEKVRLYPVRNGEFYRDEAEYPSGGSPGRNEAGFPNGGSPGREPVRGFLAALDLAALGLQGQAGNRVLYAAFNGLSTAGPMDFTQNLLRADPEAVADALEAQGNLVDLSGVHVVLTGLGDVAGEQAPSPSPPRRTSRPSGRPTSPGAGRPA